MNKRDLIQALLTDTTKPATTPAAFFLHFDSAFHRGRGAVDKHIEYFRHTGMDLVKIQFEQPFPKVKIEDLSDWSAVRAPDRPFYDEQVDVVRGIVSELKNEAMVVVTLYSPFMCAGQVSGHETIDTHLARDPEAVEPVIRDYARSLLEFVEACADVGVDGFYASTQGGEAARAYGGEVFTRYIRPSDRIVWDGIAERCKFNILHVCDFWGPYDSIDSFADYPGEIVSAPTDLADGILTGSEIAHIFDRPFLGGMDRHGEIATGNSESILRAAYEALAGGPTAQILGASCTLPSDTDWDNVRVAVDTAHQFPAS